MSKLAIQLIVVLGFTIANILSLHSSCSGHFEAFSLPDDYNRNVPSKDKIVTVNNVIRINEVLEINEEHQTISFKLTQMAWWKDERIKVDNSHLFWNHPNGQKAISLDGKFVHNCLWTPKLTLHGLDELETWTPSAQHTEGSPLAFHLFNNGLVVETLESVKILIECGMHFEHYPFDVQVCDVATISSLSNYFQGEMVDLKKKVTFDHAAASHRELQFHINSTKRLFDSSGNVVGVRIVLIRSMMHYVLDCYIPTSLAVMISWFSFVIDPKIGIAARSTALVTLLLILVNISISLLRESPITSGSNQLLVWCYVCIAMVVIAILEYCVILWLIRFKPESSENSKGIMSRYFKNSVIYPSEGRKESKCPEKQRYTTPTGIQLDSNLELEMMQKAGRIDKRVLISMPFIFIVVLLVYFLDGFYGKHRNLDEKIPDHLRQKYDQKLLEEIKEDLP